MSEQQSEPVESNPDQIEDRSVSRKRTVRKSVVAPTDGEAPSNRSKKEKRRNRTPSADSANDSKKASKRRPQEKAGKDDDTEKKKRKSTSKTKKEADKEDNSKKKASARKKSKGSAATVSKDKKKREPTSDEKPEDVPVEAGQTEIAETVFEPINQQMRPAIVVEKQSKLKWKDADEE